MFDIGATELLLVVIVAILVIGPKDMPTALRAAGRWIGKARRVSNHFRSGIDAMIREAEIEDMEKKWADQNAQIMAQHPNKTDGEGSSSDQLSDEEIADHAAAEARARALPDTGLSPDHAPAKPSDSETPKSADAADEAAIRKPDA